MTPALAMAPNWAHTARVLGARYEEKDRLREFAEIYAANVIILYLVPEMSNGWCPDGTYDEIAKFVEVAHQHDLKVLGYFDSSTADEAFYTGDHRTWVQVNAAGEPQYYRPRHIPQGRYCYCVNSPWSQYILDIVSREIPLGIDGMFLDNPAYYEHCGPSCFCGTCREKFLEETGSDITEVDRAEQKAWAQRQHSGLFRNVCGLFEDAGRSGDYVVTSNYSGSRLQDPAALAMGENVLFCEIFSLDEVAARATVAESKRIAGDRPVWTIVTLPGTGGAESYLHQKASDYEQLFATLDSEGGRPMLWTAPTSMNPLHPGFAMPPFYDIPQFASMVKRCFGALAGTGEESSV